MVRCEEKIIQWKDGDVNNIDLFEDYEFKVKSLDLINSDYICNSDLRIKISKKQTKQAYLRHIP